MDWLIHIVKEFFTSILPFPIFFLTQRSYAVGDEFPAGDANQGLCPIGVILPFGGSSAPTGWLLCTGQAVSRTTYADLFDEVGTIFGIGDGSTTFNVPDMRGNFPLGKDDMGGSSRNRVTHANADTVGAEEGAEDHTLIEAEMPAHTHTVRVTAGATQQLSGGANVAGSGESGSTGGDGAHENMSPYMTLNYIIHAQIGT